MKTTLIAPCGMNCRLCRAYERERNACPGCRFDDHPESIARAACRIKNCETLASGKTRFCFSCAQYPCGALSHLDKRYRTKYGMSMTDNLENIRRSGVREFVRQEKKRWVCRRCGEIICVHRASCENCGHGWR